jgi:ribonuclease H / adenosylcobalamin/alpha-ribazole phosphatase
VTRRLTVEADGGSRGNPGVAGYGALVRDTDTGALLAERAEPLGKASNNVAEYRGLIAGLEAAAAIDPSAEVLARLDSKLVVEQMSGRWKIKHEDMRRLALQARDLASSITAAGGSVRYEWIPREINKDADALSNVAMDGHTVDRTFEGPTVEAAGGDTVDAAPATGIPVRVVLVVQAVTDEARRVAAAAVSRLVGSGHPNLLTASSAAATATAGTIGAALGVDPVVEPGWDEAGDRLPRVWDRAVALGGTTVVVGPADAVRAALGHLLGVPEERRDRIAAAAGSLAGVEVWDDDRVRVAFTNRT